MTLLDNYRCPECGQEFPTAEQLGDHARSQHTSGYRCADCGASFRSQSELDDHNRQFHPR